MRLLVAASWYPRDVLVGPFSSNWGSPPYTVPGSILDERESDYIFQSIYPEASKQEQKCCLFQNTLEID
jgi:hypothetical protein